MNDKELWDRVCQLIQPQMPMVSYTTWIENGLKPAGLRDDVFYAEANTDFIYSFVERNWASLIDNALIQAAGRPVRLQLVHKGEQPELPAQPKTQEADHASSELNPAYTFDTFVVGSANRFAHAACLAVAEAPADAYNPLFLYGGVGLGKTHLMHAIGHFVLNRHPETVVRYVTTETFTNELIEAIQQKRTAEFRDRYRKCDLLLIDDIQFLAKKESTQEEFHNTFNALHDAGKQIVITSDRPPKDIPKLTDRLTSRFTWGLIADISKPDFETRMAILQKKCADDMLDIDREVLEMIASRVESNIRELEGCLKRLSAYSSLTGRRIDRKLAEDALREVFQSAKPQKLSCDDIIEAVAQYYNLSGDDLKGPRRNREISVPRQIAMYLCREVGDASFPHIGDAFGRDHSTIQHGCDRIAEERRDNPSMATVIDDLTKQLQER